jgi:hypothetical protein
VVKLVHRGFPTTELRDEHGVGLPGAFEELDRVVAAALQRSRAGRRDFGIGAPPIRSSRPTYRKDTST